MARTCHLRLPARCQSRIVSHLLDGYKANLSRTLIYLSSIISINFFQDFLMPISLAVYCKTHALLYSLPRRSVGTSRKMARPASSSLLCHDFAIDLQALIAGIDANCFAILDGSCEDHLGEGVLHAFLNDSL